MLYYKLAGHATELLFASRVTGQWQAQWGEIDGCWLYVLWPYKKYAQLITRHEVAGVTILAATVVTGNDFIISRVLLSQPHHQTLSQGLFTSGIFVQKNILDLGFPLSSALVQSFILENEAQDPNPEREDIFVTYERIL